MKKARKTLAMLMCCTLFLGLFATASAEDTMDNTWKDIADISWYSDSESEFHINTAEQLAGLAELVNGGNTFSGKTIYLDRDLDLSDNEWVSIGTGNNISEYFGGIFDGKNHTISNLTSKTVRLIITDFSV